MLRVLRPLSVLDAIPRPVLTLATVSIVVTLGWLDHEIGTRMGLSVLYLVPVVVSAWSAGRIGGVITGAVAAVAWLEADLGAEHVPGLDELATRNFASHTIICLGLALVVSALRRSIDALELAFARERQMARHDPLTGLVNGRVFREAVDTEIARMGRGGAPFVVAYMDANGFKAVNDARGHAEGDRVLRATATTLLSVQRRTDTVARMGGDEFAVLMPGTTREEAMLALAKVRSALTTAMATGGWRVSFSIGAVAAVAPGGALPVAGALSADTLIARADAAMFVAKRRGGHGLEVATHDGMTQGDLFAVVP